MEVFVADYARDREEIHEVRRVVFIVEQKVPPEIEVDDRDAHCCHVLVRDNGRAIGTGRIDIEKDGKVGRVAVINEYRDRGVGRDIMNLIEQVAAEAGQNRLWFHAQTRAVPFYERLGYQCDGDEFMEADIPHRCMSKRLM